MKRLDHRELVVIVRTRRVWKKANWANNVICGEEAAKLRENTDSLSDHAILAKDLQRTVQRQRFYGTAFAVDGRRLEE